MWGSVKLCTFWLSGRTGRENIGWSWPKVKCFPVRPDLNQSISIFYHMTVVLFFWQSENAFMAAFASFRARFSRRALCVFPALSLIWRVQPSELFFHMVFQRNCARGRTDHMIKCDESRYSTVISRSRFCTILSYPGYQRFFSRAAGIFGVGRRPTHLRL